MSAGGSRIKWCMSSSSSVNWVSESFMRIIDPMGGLIVRINVAFTLDSADSQIKISLAIIAAWGRTSYKQFSLLAGKAAPHEFLQLIIYKASTFAPEIEKLDTVRAYHVRHDQSIF